MATIPLYYPPTDSVISNLLYKEDRATFEVDIAPWNIAKTKEGATVALSENKARALAKIIRVTVLEVYPLGEENDLGFTPALLTVALTGVFND